MKKYLSRALSVFIFVMLIFNLTACTNGNNSNDENSNNEVRTYSFVECSNVEYYSVEKENKQENQLVNTEQGITDEIPGETTGDVISTQEDTVSQEEIMKEAYNNMFKGYKVETDKTYAKFMNSNSSIKCTLTKDGNKYVLSNELAYEISKDALEHGISEEELKEGLKGVKMYLTFETNNTLKLVIDAVQLGDDVGVIVTLDFKLV